MFCVLCVFNNLLSQIQKDFPRKRLLLHRSNNVGCYSGTGTILEKQKICAKYNINLQQILFYEPQRSKDQADRDSAVLKHRLNSYVDAGNDIKTAEQLFSGILWQEGLLNMKPCKLAVKPELGALNVPTIEGITNCHNIEFGVNTTKVWRYYKIGEAKEIPIKDFEMDLTYTVVRRFPDAFPTGFKTRIKEPNKSPKKDDKGVTILECPEENCICTFEKMEALNTHLGQLLSSEDTHILDFKSKMRLYFAEYFAE